MIYKSTFNLDKDKCLLFAHIRVYNEMLIENRMKLACNLNADYTDYAVLCPVCLTELNLEPNNTGTTCCNKHIKWYPHD